MNNVYNSLSVAVSTPTVVNGLTVPARGGYSLKGLIIWCKADCLIEIKKNLTSVGGGLLTGTNPTLFIDFSASPFGLMEKDVLSVIATIDDASTPPGSYIISSTLLVEQL